VFFPVDYRYSYCEKREASHASLFRIAQSRKGRGAQHKLHPKLTAIIRHFTDLCKQKFEQYTDRQLFDDAYSYFLLSEVECPYCHAKKLTYHSSYTRQLISIVAQNSKYIGIDRYKCPVCNRTHALLPDIITPYSPYSLRFKLDAIKAYKQRSGSVEALCAELNIAISTLYHWLKIFKDHKRLHLGVISNTKTSVIDFACQLRDGSTLSRILEFFFASFGFSFWQGRRHIPASGPSPIFTQDGFP
jgi:transposase-like protein